MELKKKVFLGIKWTSFATINNSLVQIAKLAILTRILDSSNFGLIAIVLMITGFFELFSGMGLFVALLHKQEVSQKQYSSIFWINLLIGITLFVIACFSTSFIADFYNEPVLCTLLPLMAIQLLLNSFGKLFYTFKQRNLEFGFISKVNIVGTYIGSISTIILAILNYEVYSLVYGMLIQTFFIQLIYTLSGSFKYKILFYCSFSDIKSLVKIGGFQVGTQILDYWSNKIDIFLIGHFFGMESLGLYNLAKELILKPVQIINPIVTNVAIPAFSKIQQEIVSVQNNYLKILKGLCAINFPIFVCFFIFANPISSFLYGSTYVGIGIFIKILSIWGLLTSIVNPAAILIVSKGRTDLGFHWTILRSIIYLIGIYWASHFSLYWVGYSQVLMWTMFTFVYWKMIIYPLSKITFNKYVTTIMFPLMISLLACLLIPLYLYFDDVICQMLFIPFYFVCYIIMYFFFDRSALSSIKMLINK